MGYQHAMYSDAEGGDACVMRAGGAAGQRKQAAQKLKSDARVRTVQANGATAENSHREFDLQLLDLALRLQR